MKSLVFTGIAAAAFVAGSMPAQASDSLTATDVSTVSVPLTLTADAAKGGKMMAGKMMRGKMRGARMGGKRMDGKMMRGKMRGPRIGGKRMGGKRMHGNRSRTFVGSYRRPFYGFSLPTYWSAPSFYISNYSNFGLSRPQTGYNWSRYYDDAVLRNNAGQVYDYRQNIDWSRGGAGYAPNGYYSQPQAPVYAPTVHHVQPQQGPSIQAESEVYGWGEETYRTAKPEGTTERGVYDGAWTGKYIDPENRVYRGEWSGTYKNDKGQVYQGTYRGTSVGDPVYRQGAGGAGAPYQQQQHAPVNTAHYPQQQTHQSYPVSQTTYPAPQQQAYRPAPAPVQQYQTPDGFYHYEKCLKKRGIAGGAIGGIVGAVAGNRIGGRGNRLAGSLIGGGIGAISGVVIEKAINKCEKYLPSRQTQPSYPQGYPQQQHYPQQQTYPSYPQQQQQPSGYGWSQGYYWAPGGYYYPPATTTVTVTPGTQTTTTTTEYVYEDVYVSRPSKRRIKAKGKRLRKPGCNC